MKIEDLSHDVIIYSIFIFILISISLILIFMKDRLIKSRIYLKYDKLGIELNSNSFTLLILTFVVVLVFCMFYITSGDSFFEEIKSDLKTYGENEEKIIEDNKELLSDYEDNLSEIKRILESLDKLKVDYNFFLDFSGKVYKNQPIPEKIKKGEYILRMYINDDIIVNFTKRDFKPSKDINILYLNTELLKNEKVRFVVENNTGKILWFSDDISFDESIVPMYHDNSN